MPRTEELLVLRAHQSLGLGVELEGASRGEGDPAQGEVVLGRAQTADREDELRAARQRRPQLVGYRFYLVADEDAATHLPAERGDSSAEPVRVGVEDVAEQHLVAGGDDLDHRRSLAPLGGRAHRRNTPSRNPERTTTATIPASTSSSRSSFTMNERTTSAASAARMMKQPAAHVTGLRLAGVAFDEAGHRRTDGADQQHDHEDHAHRLTGEQVADEDRDHEDDGAVHTQDGQRIAGAPGLLQLVTPAQRAVETESEHGREQPVDPAQGDPLFRARRKKGARGSGLSPRRSLPEPLAPEKGQPHGGRGAVKGAMGWYLGGYLQSEWGLGLQNVYPPGRCGLNRTISVFLLR